MQSTQYKLALSHCEDTQTFKDHCDNAKCSIIFNDTTEDSYTSLLLTENLKRNRGKNERGKSDEHYKSLEEERKWRGKILSDEKRRDHRI